MSAKIGILLVAVCANLAVWPGDASAVPPDQRVELQFRTLPLIPLAPVKLKAVLYLSAESTSGNAIGWRIEDIQFINIDLLRINRWSKHWVSTNDSPDGLWWVNHVDPENPTTAEFANLLPSISGNAPPLIPGIPALTFEITGTATGRTWSPYPVTAYAGYSFALANAEEPILEEEDEPVEIYVDVDA